MLQVVMAVEVQASGVRGGVEGSGGCVPGAFMDVPRMIGCTIKGGVGVSRARGSEEAGGEVTDSTTVVVEVCPAVGVPVTARGIDDAKFNLQDFLAAPPTRGWQPGRRRSWAVGAALWGGSDTVAGGMQL